MNSIDWSSPNTPNTWNYRLKDEIHLCRLCKCKTNRAQGQSSKSHLTWAESEKNIMQITQVFVLPPTFVQRVFGSHDNTVGVPLERRSLSAFWEKQKWDFDTIIAKDMRDDSNVKVKTCLLHEHLNSLFRLDRNLCLLSGSKVLKILHLWLNCYS